MAYNIFSQLSGPQIDQNLFANSAGAGIAGGTAVPSTTKAIIDGAIEGIETGQQMIQNNQQIEMNQQKIDNMPLEREVAEEQLKAVQRQEQQQLQEQQRKQQQVERENEFLGKFQNAQNNPRAQGTLLMSGEYADVLSRDPRMWEQLNQQVAARGGLNQDELNGLNYKSRRQQTVDLHQQLIEKELPKLELHSRNLENNLAAGEAADKLSATREDASMEVSFSPAGAYQVTPEGTRGEYNTELSIPEEGGSSRESFDMWSSDGKYLGRASKEEKAGIEGYRNSANLVNGTKMITAIRNLQKKSGFSDTKAEQVTQQGQGQQGQGQQAVQGQQGAQDQQAQLQNQTPSTRNRGNIRGLGRLKGVAIDSAESPSSNMEVAEGVRSELGLSEQEYQANEEIFSQFIDAAGRAALEQPNIVGRLAAGFFDPTPGEAELRSVRRQAATAIAEAEVARIRSVPGGSAMYNEQAVEDHNRQVDQFEQDQESPWTRMDSGTLFLLGTAGKLRTERVETPAELYYVRNRSSLDQRVRGLEDGLVKELRANFRAPERREQLGAEIRGNLRGMANESDFKPKVAGSNQQQSAANQQDQSPLGGQAEGGGASLGGPPRSADPLDNTPGMREVNQFIPITQQVGESFDVEPALIQAIIFAESTGNPAAGSPAGARGLMQLMPGTAADMGVEDPLDPIQNITGGTKYIKKMLEMFNGDLELALAAYNAGPGTVQRHKGIPPYRETQNYVKKVINEYRRRTNS